MVSLRNAKVGMAVLAALAWVGAITLLIAHQPDPGAATPRELRDQLAAALTAHDADALGGLLDYPGSGGEDFAKKYVDVLTGNGVHAVTVRLTPDERAPAKLAIGGLLGNGTPFSYVLAVTTEEGRWKVALTPPLP